jgi:HEAT repeat protein
MQRAADTPLRLTAAQSLLAREYGFASWPKLKAHVEAPSDNPPVRGHAELLAERWFEMADSCDLGALASALAVGKGQMQRARAVMQTSLRRYRRFLDVLVAGLKDSRPRIRFDMAHALDTFGDETCRESLEALLDDPVPRVRWMSMHALSCHACGEGLGEVGAPIMQRIAHAARTDPSIQVRRHATVCLGLSGWPEGPAVAREILADTEDSAHRRACAFVIAALERRTAA